jgi:superfamily II DNA or RNA helicase
MILRDYQDECVADVFGQLEQVKSTLIVLPTGTGKTVVFATVAHRWPDGRVLIVAHREELIYQAVEKIKMITGEVPAVEMADLRADVADGWIDQARIVVTSIQTMSRPNRMEQFRPEDFGLLIIDEAHHAPALTYRRVINYYRRNPDLRVLGVTATPDRHDEEALGQVFDSVAYDLGIHRCIEDGWLCGIDQHFVRVEGLDYSAIRTTAGDLNGADLEAVMVAEKVLHGVVIPTIELARDVPTLTFAASVAHAERMAEITNRHRPGAAFCLHGKTPGEERRAVLDRYRRGEFQFLFNCGLFLEGFDETRIGCVSVARPTKSRALYAQMIGRGTRPLAGTVDEAWMEAVDRKERIALSDKPCLLVLDFVGNSGRHKLISVADVLGGNWSDDVVERATRSARARSARGESADMMAELATACKQAEEEERQRRQAVIARARYGTVRVCPFDVFEVEPKREPGWHKGRLPTPKQLEVLARSGIPTENVTFWQASQLIDQVISRRAKGLCSFKQAKLLARFGYDINTSFEDARTIIDGLAANGWKRPAAAQG